MTNKQVDKGYAWVILMSAFFISFILDGVMYSFGIILDEIKKEVQITESVLNLMSSLNTGFLFCSGPIVTGLTKTFGCRLVVVGGAIITVIMYIGTSFSSSIYIMMILYGVIGGISTGCIYISSLIIIAEWFEKKRGLATGITMAGSGVGSFVFAPVISKLIELFGWRITMSICACIILQCGIFGALLKPLPPPGAPASDESIELQPFSAGETISGETISGETISGETIYGETISGETKTSCGSIFKEMTNFKLLVHNDAFFSITMSNFFIFIGYFTPFLYITKIAQANNISRPEASFLISTIGMVNIPFRIIFGFVTDKNFISALNLNTGSVFVATISLFLYSIMQYHYWSQLLFSIIFAIGISGINCLTTMYLCDIVGLEKFSNATGIVELFRGFGCFLGPFLAGIVSNQISPIACFFFSGICFTIGLVFAIQASLNFCIFNIVESIREVY